MRSTTVLIKPASSLCNAYCSYCFYEDVSNCREVKSHGFIDRTVWKKVVDDTINSKNNYKSINFAFQGGEPLMAGIEFFEEFIEYVDVSRKDINITYSLQTNGLLLDESFCKLFKDNDFLIGISVDGFQENHDKFRFFQQSGSFKQVMTGIELLKSYDIEFNVLTVLTKELAKHPDKLIDFYLSEEFNVVQLIPCLPNFGMDPKEDLFSLSPKLFASFYTQFYNLWLEQLEKGIYISENLIDNVVNLFIGGPVTRCGMLGQCESQCIVESDGGIYPCDFYVLDEFELGNVKENKLDKLLRSDTVNEFKLYDNNLEAICIECPFKEVCHGNCKRQRVTFLEEDYCGYRELLDRVYQTVPRVINALEKLA